MKPVPVAVIPQLYDFVTWTSAKIATYPRAHRFTVGDRLIAGMLDALDQLIEAQYSPATRQVALQQANAIIERVRYLVRLSKDLNCLSLAEYEHACHCLLGIGKMVGGWSRHQATRQSQAVPT